MKKLAINCGQRERLLVIVQLANLQSSSSSNLGRFVKFHHLKTNFLWISSQLSEIKIWGRRKIKVYERTKAIQETKVLKLQKWQRMKRTLKRLKNRKFCVGTNKHFLNYFNDADPVSLVSLLFIFIFGWGSAMSFGRKRRRSLSYIAVMIMTHLSSLQRKRIAVSFLFPCRPPSHFIYLLACRERRASERNFFERIFCMFFGLIAV